MIAATDLEHSHRQFWIRVFEIAKSGGLKPETAAQVADLALKQLKARDEDVDFEW
jgi:hypothetical protein